MAVLANLYHQHCWADNFPAQGREFFRAHNNQVRRASSGRKFLEYCPGDGWGPLCEFLGVEVPSIDYPRSDAWLEYKVMVDRERKDQAAEAQ
jgi:hypothetical protein